MVTSGLSTPINQWEHDFQLQEIDNLIENYLYISKKLTLV
jgi:hypothetical protein